MQACLCKKEAAYPLGFLKKYFKACEYTVKNALIPDVSLLMTGSRFEQSY